MTSDLEDPRWLEGRSRRVHRSWCVHGGTDRVVEDNEKFHNADGNLVKGNRHKCHSKVVEYCCYFRMFMFWFVFLWRFTEWFGPSSFATSKTRVNDRTKNVTSYSLTELIKLERSFTGNVNTLDHSVVFTVSLLMSNNKVKPRFKSKTKWS